MKALICFGTRPEFIKFIPIINLMKKTKNIDLTICCTGQHTDLVTQLTELFEIKIDVNLNVMKPGQSLAMLQANIMIGLNGYLERLAEKPDYILVHGDTISALAAAQTANAFQIPVAHVEAGMRSHDRMNPFPEEGIRCQIAQIATHHFAPTNTERVNLLAEGINAEAIQVVGNTIVDAVAIAQDRLRNPDLQAKLTKTFDYLQNKRFILLTCHRRENQGGGHQKIFKVIKQLSENKNIDVVFPVHPNPVLKRLAEEVLGGCDYIHLIEPVDYVEMQYLLSQCYMVVTDSGGLQEEAPSHGKPLLVTRCTTERQAVVKSGAAILVGTDPTAIIEHATTLLDDSKLYNSMTQNTNPFGDGHTAIRICQCLLKNHQNKHAHTTASSPLRLTNTATVESTTASSVGQKPTNTTVESAAADSADQQQASTIVVPSNTTTTP